MGTLIYLNWCWNVVSTWNSSDLDQCKNHMLHDLKG